MTPYAANTVTGAAAETQNEFMQRQVEDAQVADEAIPANPATLTMIEPALMTTIKMVCP
jgi:hypothetical protein